MTPTDTLREAVARALCTSDGFHEESWEVYLSGADAALSAIEAAGWRVVPAEPTEAMTGACWNLFHPWGTNAPHPRSRPEGFKQMQRIVADFYREMLFAAPRLDATVRGEEG